MFVIQIFPAKAKGNKQDVYFVVVCSSHEKIYHWESDILFHI